MQSMSFKVRELDTGITSDQLTASIEAVYNLEKSIAGVMTPDSERRNSTAMYNPYTLAELKESFGDFDWETYLSMVFSDTGVTVTEDERFILVQPDYFARAGDLPQVSMDVICKFGVIEKIL